MVSYNPRVWCQAKIIYTDKQGKESCDQAKSFRPISLTSFMLKTLERLVYWQIQETTVKTNPYISNQWLATSIAWGKDFVS